MATDDRDWLEGDDAATQAELVGSTLEQNPGCFCFDAPGDLGRTFSSLFAAMTHPPRTDEAWISDANGKVLALAHPDRCVWVATFLGVRWLAREMRELLPEAKTPLVYCREPSDDREDFAEEWEREDRREQELAGERS